MSHEAFIQNIGLWAMVLPPVRMADIKYPGYKAKRNNATDNPILSVALAFNALLLGFNTPLR